MTPENRTRLDTYETDKQKKKLEQEQRYAIGKKHVDTKTTQYNSSMSASNDDYMRKALLKVREDKRSHSDTLTRFNGSYLHSKSQ